MQWLVDGYNVIRRDADLRGAEEESLRAARAALLRLVAGVVARSGERFTVVFDGAPTRGPEAATGQIEVVFSRAPETADDVLIRLARRHHEGAIVVSSDRTVSHAATRAGCTVLTSEQFLGAARAGTQGDVADRDDDDEREEPLRRRGNPHRLSKEERAAQRALGRLRGR